MIEIKTLEILPKETIYVLPPYFKCHICGLGLGHPFWIIQDLTKNEFIRCPNQHKIGIRDLVGQIFIIREVKDENIQG